MTTKECSSCKTSNPISASFCRKCGHRFPEYTKPGKSQMCHIENFSIKKQSNGKFLVEWVTVNADKVILNGRDVTGQNKFIATIKGCQTISLRAENATSYDEKEANVVYDSQTIYKDKIVEKRFTSGTNVFAIVFLVLFILLSALLIHYAYQLENRNYSGDRYLSNIFGYKPYLLVNGSNEGRNVNVPAQGASLMYDVKTNASEYEVLDLPNWCTLEKNDSFFILQAIRNRLIERTADIKIRTAKDSIIIHLKQNVYKPSMLLVNNETSLESHLGALSGSVTYQIETDALDYEIKSLPSWVTITSKSKNSFTISYSENTSNDYYREGQLVVAAEGMKSMITIKQSAKNITGKFKNIDIQHSTKDGIKGIKVLADFTLNHMCGVDGQYAVYFYHTDGRKLLGNNKQYCTAEGHVATSKSIKPPYVGSSYTAQELFIPSNEIITTKGKHNLMLHCVIWEYSNANAVKVIQSKDYSFTLTNN